MSRARGVMQATVVFWLCMAWGLAARAQTTYLCPPYPAGVTGLSGGPQFAATTLPDTLASQLDNPRWTGACREDFSASQSTQAAARILTDGSNLFFSLQAVVESGRRPDRRRRRLPRVQQGRDDRRHRQDCDGRGSARRRLRERRNVYLLGQLLEDDQRRRDWVAEAGASELGDALEHPPLDRRGDRHRRRLGLQREDEPGDARDSPGPGRPPRAAVLPLVPRSTSRHR